MNALELSDEVGRLMKEARKIDYVDFECRSKILNAFLMLRMALILAS